jgi:hypothetical protein
MPDAIPCRICGCREDEPGLCHAVRFDSPSLSEGGCWRRPDDWGPDLCAACVHIFRADREAGLPDDACRANNRAYWADLAAQRRGASVPGGGSLRWHARRMKAKARLICRKAGADPYKLLAEVPR